MKRFIRSLWVSIGTLISVLMMSIPTFAASLPPDAYVYSAVTVE